MRYLRFFFLSTLLAAVLAFSACERDDVQPTGNEGPLTPQPDPALQLAGTSWRAMVDNDFYYYGMAFHVRYYSFIDFLDGEQGEQFDDMTVTYPAIFQAPDEQETNTTSFSYTTDPDGGTMHVVQDIAGEHYEYDTPFEYDKDSGTIRINIDDSDLEEMLGTDVMVYEKIRP